MSFPYVLDLSFGSEKSTADPQGRLSFGSGNSGLPKTQEELEQAEEAGLAYFANFGADNTLILSNGKIPNTVVETLPGNLKGIVIENPEDMSVASHTCTVTTDPLVITVNSVPEGINGAYIILKQAVD